MSNVTSTTENKKTYSDKWLYIIFGSYICLKLISIVYGTTKHYHLDVDIFGYLISFFIARFAHHRLQKKMASIPSAIISFLIGIFLPLAIISLPYLFILLFADWRFIVDEKYLKYSPWKQIGLYLAPDEKILAINQLRTTTSFFSYLVFKGYALMNIQEFFLALTNKRVIGIYARKVTGLLNYKNPLFISYKDISTDGDHVFIKDGEKVLKLKFCFPIGKGKQQKEEFLQTLLHNQETTYWS